MRKIYFAAGLFNKAQRLFNSQLASRMEDLSYTINLPQREGFEGANLEQFLNRIGEGNAAWQEIVYYFDMGKLVPDSDVLIANIDDPMDEGVLIEQMHAASLGKPIVSYRTESRSPHGSIQDVFHGAHPFPVMMSDAFVYCNTFGMPDESSEFNILANSLHAAIVELPDQLPADRFSKKILHNSDHLFNGTNDIHSEEALAKISERFKTLPDDRMPTLYVTTDS